MQETEQKKLWRVLSEYFMVVRWAQTQNKQYLRQEPCHTLRIAISFCLVSSAICRKPLRSGVATRSYSKFPRLLLLLLLLLVVDFSLLMLSSGARITHVFTFVKDALFIIGKVAGTTSVDRGHDPLTSRSSIDAVVPKGPSGLGHMTGAAGTEVCVRVASVGVESHSILEFRMLLLLSVS